MQAVRSKQNNSSVAQDDGESEVTGRVVGTVRRHIPIDTRDPPGAILHYYVGDSYDPSRQVFIRIFPLRFLDCVAVHLFGSNIVLKCNCSFL